MSLIRSTALLAALLCVFVCISGAPIDEAVPQPFADPEYRLPATIKPSAYNLILRPYLIEGDANRFTFDGEVYINITTTAAIGTLVIHSKNLNYILSEYWNTATTPPPQPTPLPTPVIDEITDKRTYTLTSNLVVGAIYTLHFKYVGSMDDDMAGFYRSSYVDSNNVTKWLGSTQFETISARRAFPSFDEPKFKATFDLTLIRHKSMKTNANTRILNTIRDGDYYTDVYERTPPMSTYLLAFLVSEFSERFDGDFGVIARPEYYGQTEYSSTVGKKILSEFDKYLDMPYHEQGIDKMHMAAIPDFSAGAMENWGLLTYRERALLYDPYSSSLNYKQSISTIVAHEQAHMWFGDIVTCDWWSYTWLNEGFAAYFQYHMTAKVETDFRLDQQFVVAQLQSVMGMDSTNNTNPMSNEDTNSPSDLSRMFNSISYNKGGSVIRMVKYAMGEENFQNSLQEYLKVNKYKNAVPNDLLAMWEKHWPAATRPQAPLVFRSFTEQVGYPVVTVNVSDDGRSMTINQTRFLLKSDDGSDPTLLYTIPITYTTSEQKNFDATVPILYLEASHSARTETFAQAASWVIANIQETGYYRVNYDTANWHQIHRALLTSNWGGIHELNRAQIVDDLFQFARANVIDYDFALAILEYLDTELNYLPWTSAFNGYNYLAIRLGADTTNFGAHIRKQLQKAYNYLGFDEKSTDTSLDIFNRAKVLAWSCKYGNENCINQAKLHFNNLQSTPVPANIRTVVYCSSMREGTEDDYDILFNKFKTETVATEQALILGTLGCVKAQSLIEKHFNNILSGDIRRQDKSAALTSLYSENNENVTPVFDLATGDFEKLANAMGGYSAVASAISGIASRFTEKDQEQKLKDFNTANKAQFGAAAATLEAAENTVAENLAWSSERMGTFKLYLQKRASADPEYRLPLTIKPSAYNIILRPYLIEGDTNRFTFDGEVYINISTTAATETLVIHSKNLNYTLSEYWNTATTPPPSPTPLPTPFIDEVTNKRTYTLASTLAVGAIYTLHFKYVGSMDDDMAGFYRSSYVDSNNVTKWLGSTQFETISARRAFPSFDEPKFKATFDLTLIHHKSMKTYSNTRIINTIRDGDYYTDVYERTPPMSTYLLAFLVSEFNERFDGDFGVIARPEYYDQTEYSSTVGKKILSEFDKYLNMPYYEQGIDKMHMAAIPDFSAGAMENWGLLTYRERALLYDPYSSSLNYKQSISTIVAHEQAHMWFGDIVTCDWWSYTWLNEGFANYFQYHMTAKVETDFRLDQQFVVDQLQTVMGMDSTNNTNPMSNEDTNSPSDLSRMFNSISYNKGGSVIRMVKHAMGEENFQKSLQEYLTANKHKNTVPNDLLEMWQKYWPAATRAQAPLVFRSFTEQVGYPVVTINVSADRTTMTINQTRFLLKSDDGSDAALLYTIPFTYTTSEGKNFDTTDPTFYLEASHSARTETFGKNVSWVIANIQETGYYRVNYDTASWHQIHHALLSSNWGGIHELNRAQIVDDLFQLARANVIDYDLALAVLEYLETELNYLPWTSAFNGYNYLAIRVGTETKNFGIYIRQLLDKAYNQLGFVEKSNDTSLDIFNRAKVLSWSCKYGNENCINQAKLHFNDLQSTPVPANIRTVVYCSTMREGSENDYDILFNKFKTETVATEQVLILSSLGCVKAQNLIEKHFNNILSGDIRRQDKSAALTSLYSENNENVTPVFDLVTRDFVKLADAMGGYSAVASAISGIASRFTEKDQEQKLKDFNTANKAQFGAAAATLEAAETTVAENLAWSDDRLGTFKLYLDKRARGSASAIKSFTALTIAIVALFSMLLR